MFDERQKEQYLRLSQIEQARRRLAEDPKPDVDDLVRHIVDAAGQIQKTEAQPSQPSPDARQVLRRAAGRATDASPDNLSASSELLSAATTGIDAAVALRMTHVPTALVHVFEPSEYPLVSFELANHTNRGVRLRVQSYIEGYSAHAVETVEIPERQLEPRVITQLPTLFPASLETVREATRATVHVNVDDLDVRGAEHRTEDQRTFRVWLLPKTTAILYQRDPSDNRRRDMTDYLSCWVTPNAPSVMQCLREAADQTGSHRMIGYQGEAADVEEQVSAIFQTIKACGITYVNSVLAVGAADAAVQRIRLPRESLERRSANCIDGTVLFASVIEAASLDPAIVVIPGHAFLAWRSSRHGDWDYLETTMTGSSEFEAAREAGRRAYKDVQEEGLAISVLDIARLRSEGFFPLE